jgi:acyl-coenzyme A thioesterase PaaI-like protein
MGACILYSQNPEYSVATLNLSSNFLGVARVGEWLVGRAVIDGASKSYLFASGSLSGADGIVATATGTFSKIRIKTPVANFRELVKALLQSPQTV